MSSPDVDQYGVLNRLLRDALAAVRPRTLLVLGCAAGNGLEHVDSGVTSRVVAVDINRRYLEKLAGRFPDPGFDLQVQCADLENCQWPPAMFDLVHAALVFEYVDWPTVLSPVASALRPAGVLSVVLQRPSPGKPAVTPTSFASLRSLEFDLRFVDPDALAARAASHGLSPESQRTQLLPSGKAFEVLRFRKDVCDADGRARFTAHPTTRTGGPPGGRLLPSGLPVLDHRAARRRPRRAAVADDHLLSARLRRGQPLAPCRVRRGVALLRGRSARAVERGMRASTKSPGTCSGALHDGMRPVEVIPAGRWQAARTTGSYTLVGCTVGPGFDFADFEMLDQRPDEAEAVQAETSGAGGVRLAHERRGFRLQPEGCGCRDSMDRFAQPSA